MFKVVVVFMALINGQQTPIAHVQAPDAVFDTEEACMEAGREAIKIFKPQIAEMLKNSKAGAEISEARISCPQVERTEEIQPQQIQPKKKGEDI